MSDVITQKCAVCGAYKDPSKMDVTKWLSVPYLKLGTSAQPVRMIRPPNPAARMAGLNLEALDFCADCQPKTTLDKLPLLYLAKPKA